MPRQWPLLYLAAAAVFASLIRFPVSHGFRTDSWPCNRNFGCGRLTNLSFPFWPDIPTNSDVDRSCDVPGFGLMGCDSGSYPLIYLGGYDFLVLGVNQSGLIGSMTVVHKKLWDFKPAVCQWNFPIEWKLDDPNLLRYSETNLNLSLFYNCPHNAVVNFPLKNVPACGRREALWVNNLDVKQPDGCDGSFNFTVNRYAYEALQNGSVDFWGALRIGFDLKFDLKFDFAEKCERDSDAGGTPKCKLRGSRSSHLKLIMGIAVGIAIAASLTFLFIYSLRKVAQNSNWEIEASIKRQANSIPKRFSFSEVKKITNSLKEKLGQGGYGIVYRGKLPNGHPVAVKVLKVSKGSGQDFVNEVVSISRTSHVNVVTLLGFCLEAKRRALIYEFMSNGSLDKFIYNGMRITLKGKLILGWDTLYRIAVEIAQGLEYLHNGCNTRIVHFDIKPHNILLDENLCPKISDFGLAKLCTGRESIVSLLDVRGTVGYIAPEVFSRTFGNISHKSDVYSYGMMVLEMAGGRKNRDVGISHTSEVYFPTWIYQQLELEGELKLQGIVTSEELNIAKKMMIVGLWCIQTKPSDRPSISKVIEMLEGSLDVLQIPPKPYLSSPPRAQPDGTFSSTSL